MAVSGYDYQEVKKDLFKFETIDPTKLAMKEKTKSKPTKESY